MCALCTQSYINKANLCALFTTVTTNELICHIMHCHVSF